ncbi:uncharacterized protein MELLADRAFT_114638 [Melampsora larici-populina 98AG31]|uniref:non-specific serine/threonine protein kinase n=1 Tax=Melampsora larici-populina (strain 98AG31 / pathotype 3-4-7) TaxID=747676 RepID=F4SE82_MELLP|nr:uncharacterized protein MELLADRAFT_114638 [Melampsora larici-populina 98AG31]EGF97046.1 hypothetical protein MELLADRAFT_114638 [Melampsora larici-populina 98AG31]
MLLIYQIEGCISTGKEANVYHVISIIDHFTNQSKPISLALKIYKTLILVFKDRDRYMKGEFRFRQEMNKMVVFKVDAHLRNLGQGLEGLYWELRFMYQQCKLVHADLRLSEYNILYNHGHLYIIDVSQSVKPDHPSSFGFLQSDLTNEDQLFLT